MPLGFDLTNIQAAPQARAPEPAQPAPQPRTAPNPMTGYAGTEQAPSTVEQALTTKIQADLVDEEGKPFVADKLKRANPALHRELWQIDKFANPVAPVQKLVEQEDGSKRLVWIDANGNNILDPNTGSIQLKPTDSSGNNNENSNQG